MSGLMVRIYLLLAILFAAISLVSATETYAAPIATISGVPQSPTSSTGAILAVGGYGVVAYKYRLDYWTSYSAENQKSTSIALTDLPDGQRTLYVIGKDSAGSWQAEASATTATWTVDTTAPALTVSTLSDGESTGSTILNIAGNVTDVNGVKSLVINGANVEVKADGTFSHALSLNAGANVITTVSVDLAGNWASDKRTVILDLIPPKLDIELPTDNSITAKSFVEVSGTIDEPSDIEIAVENSLGTNQAVKLASVNTKYSATVNLAAGLNTIHVSATDLLGNKSTTQKRTITYDDQKPSLAVTEPGQDVRTEQSSVIIRGTVTDALSAVTVTLTKDAETFTPPVVNGAFEQEIKFAAQQVYHINVKATDEAGNYAEVLRNIIYAKPASGDINNDLTVDLVDAIRALRIAVGLVVQTDDDLLYGDVAPLVSGRPAPDGRIGVGDAVIILKIIVGMVIL